MDRPLEKPPIYRRRTAVAIAGVIVGIAAVCIWARATFSENTLRLPRTKISVGTVARGAFRDFIPLRMTIVSRDIVFVDAAEGGRVESVHVNPGDIVTKGQPLVSLSNTRLELQVLEQEGRLIESLTQVQNYQTSLAQNRLSNELSLKEIEYNIKRLTRSLGRRQVLAKDGIISRESVDEIEDELESLKRKHELQALSNREQEDLRLKQMPQIAAQISSLQRDMVITRSKLESLIVRAPSEGRLTTIDLKIGQTLHEGDRLAQVTRDTGFRLTQQVDEFYLGRLRVGLQGAVQVEGKEWPIHLSRVYPQIKEGSFTVDFEFAGTAPTNLLPGQTVVGKLTLGNTQNAVFVPTGPYLEQTGGAWVFVLLGDGSGASRRAIELGRRNTEQIEVLGGLSPGDQFITSDYTGMERVSRVRFE